MSRIRRLFSTSFQIKDESPGFYSPSVCFQAENSALSMENDNQRKQYERCLDEVRPLFTVGR